MKLAVAQCSLPRKTSKSFIITVEPSSLYSMWTLVQSVTCFSTHRNTRLAPQLVVIGHHFCCPSYSVSELEQGDNLQVITLIHYEAVLLLVVVLCGISHTHRNRFRCAVVRYTGLLTVQPASSASFILWAMLRVQIYVLIELAFATLVLKNGGCASGSRTVSLSVCASL